MTTYLLTLQYQGTDFWGWQVQAEGRTIQGELEKGLKKLFKSEEISTLGSGRTDAGVHALAQKVRIKVPASLPESAFTRGLNDLLPAEMRILDARLVGENFHPIRDCLEKEYHYLFSQERMHPQLRDAVAYYPKTLDRSILDQAFRLLEGQHDFLNFSTKGTEVSSTIRTIKKIDLDCLPEPLFSGEKGPYIHRLRFTGDGFLKQMVRLLVGALWEIGQGRASLEQLQEHLENPSKADKLGAVAPACGLYLARVTYANLD